MFYVRDSYPLPGKATATYWILGINFLSWWAVSTYYSDLNRNLLFQIGGVIPAHFYNPETLNPELLNQKPQGIVTLIWYLVLHGDFMHFLTNGIALVIFGPNVEKYMGSLRFILFFVCCGAVGAFCQILFDLKSIFPIIGASGAISGLFGAYFAIFPKNYIRITVGSTHGNYRDFMLPFKVFLIAWLAMELVNGLLPDPTHTDNTAYWTHLGGFACGYLLANPRNPLEIGKRKFKVFDGGRSGQTGVAG